MLKPFLKILTAGTAGFFSIIAGYLVLADGDAAFGRNEGSDDPNPLPR